MKSKQSPPAEADVINVILSADQGHAPFAAAVIRSVAFSANADDRLSFFVLTLGLPKPDEEKFAQLSKTLEVPIKVITAADDLVAGLPDKGRTKTAYLRMFAGALLPNVKSVIYLDTDILVRCSLSEIVRELKPGVFSAVAIRDPAVLTKWPGLSQEVSAGFEKEDYFNSGVMALDLDYMRETKAHQVLPKIRAALKESILHDQSALNVFFQGRVMFLPIYYNYIIDAYDSIFSRNILGSSELSKAYWNPKIVHFANYKKPWHKRFPQRFASEYRSHLVKTPWGRDALPQLTLRQKVGRVVRIVPYFRRMIAVRRIWLIEKLTR